MSRESPLQKVIPKFCFWSYSQLVMSLFKLRIFVWLPHLRGLYSRDEQIASPIVGGNNRPGIIPQGLLLHTE